MTQHEHWDDYWEQGHLTSFGGELTQNYDDAIKAFWLRVIATCQSDERVLDLCSGNGSLPELFFNLAKERQLALGILGVDLADVTEFEKCHAFSGTSSQLKVSLKGKVSAESTGLEANQFSLITSQFGLEYTNLDLSLKEVARLLTEQGRFVWLCHSSNSRLFKENMLILDFLNSFFTANVLETLQCLVKELEVGQTDKSERYRASLNESLAQLNQYNAEVFEFLNIRGFLKAVFTKANHALKAEVISLFETDLRNYQLRLDNLAQAAKSESQLKLSIDHLAKLGLRLTEQVELNDQWGVLAHQLAFIKE